MIYHLEIEERDTRERESTELDSSDTNMSAWIFCSFTSSMIIRHVSVTSIPKLDLWLQETVWGATILKWLIAIIDRHHSIFGRTAIKRVPTPLAVLLLLHHGDRRQWRPSEWYRHRRTASQVERRQESYAHPPKERQARAPERYTGLCILSPCPYLLWPPESVMLKVIRKSGRSLRCGRRDWCYSPSFYTRVLEWARTSRGCFLGFGPLLSETSISGTGARFRSWWDWGSAVKCSDDHWF